MQHASILALAGLRIDGRRSDDLRHFKYRLGILENYDGSAYIEHGLNKVLCLVTGPQEGKRTTEYAEKGDIKCHVIISPFSGSERKKKRVGDRRIQEIEKIVVETLVSIIMLDLYVRSEIVVTVHVLESDGSLICTILNTVSLALMDAGIAMTDVITSCSAGLVLDNMVQDLSQVEQNSGGAHIAMAMKSRTEEVLFLQSDSRISLENLQVALELATNGCRKIHSTLEIAIKEAMSQGLAMSHVVT